MKNQENPLSLPKLELIAPPSTSIEEACLNLDVAIDGCIINIKKIRKSVKFLKKHLEHPFHVEALDNITGLIDEALIPYLAELDKEFRVIATT